MTTKKKLLIVGVIIGILLAIFTLLPKGLGGFLTSDITNGVCEENSTKNTNNVCQCNPGYTSSTINGIAKCRPSIVNTGSPKKFAVGPLTNDGIKRNAPVIFPTGEALIEGREYILAYRSGSQFQCNTDNCETKGNITFFLPEAFNFPHVVTLPTKGFTYNGGVIQYQAIDSDYGDNFTNANNPWYYEIQEKPIECPSNMTAESGYCGVFPLDIPQAPSVTVQNTGGVNLSWSSPAVRGPAIIDYIVEYASQSDNIWRRYDDGISPNTSVQIPAGTFADQTSYIFRVSAYNGSENSRTKLGADAVTPKSTNITAQLSITGTMNVGGSLFATFAPVGTTATYQWQRSDVSTGPYVNIPTNATGQQYNLVADDLNKFIRVVATGNGTYFGTLYATTPQTIGAILTYAVTTSAGTHGTIEASKTVNHGATTTFTVTPNTGYTATVTGTCGGTLTGTTYTTNAITAPCTVIANFSDITAPTVTAFTIPETSTSLTVSVSSFTATDTVGVTGYMITATNTSPTAATTGWQVSAPGSFEFPAGTAIGSKTLYAWVKDGAGNISSTVSDTVTIALNSAPTCTGDFPNNAVVVKGIDNSTTSSPWVYNSSQIGPYSFCTFRCNSQSTYNSTNNTCVANTTSLVSVGDITGTLQVGHKLTSGTILPSGATVTYKWQQGTGTGSFFNPTDISGATGHEYTLAGTDLGKYIRVVVTGTGVYSGTAMSALTAAITADTTAPATPTTAPTITGGTTNGLPTLTAKCSESGSTITWYIGTTVLTTAVCPTTGTFPQDITKTLTTPLTNGTHAITYSEKDTATPSNESGKSPAASITVALSTQGAPTILSITSPKPNGSYGPDTLIPILIEFSEPVTVTSVPKITLETGTVDAIANYELGTGTNMLFFHYIVQTPHTTSDLDVKSLNLTAEHTIKDADGIVVNTTLPIDSSKTLAGTKEIIIDTTAPDVPVAKPIIPTQTGVTANTDRDTFVISTTSPITLSVACAAGNKVQIYSGITLLTSYAGLTATACVNNIATIQIILPTNTSYYSLYTKYIDAAGNVSGPSPMISFIRDPAIFSNAPGTPDMDPLYDLGSSSTDNLTSVTQPLFTVSCISGAIVNLYDGTNTTPIGAAQCFVNTAQILVAQQLTAGQHTIAAKQIINGAISDSSPALTVTVDTTPLTVTLARAVEQSEPATSATIRFIATFSRPIDANSFICSDITVVNGACTSVALLSGNTYTITAVATTQGLVKISLYPGRVQTPAGNLNTEATGVNTVTYGTAVATAECSTLRRFTTSEPRNSSLNGQTLCRIGNPSSVSYNSSNLKWTYQCRSTIDGSTANCSVAALLNSAPTCQALELPLSECQLTNTSNLYYFYEYLDCLGIAKKSSCNKTYGCPQEAKRQELVYIADQLRGIPLDEKNYECQGNHTDTERNGVASWVCEAAEKAQVAKLISTTNTKFRPLDTMTRAEAYSVLMKSICIHPDTTYKNWQTEVAKAAKEYGFTTRSVSAFEPNRQILRQELYVLAARVAEYKEENPDTCDELPEELICEV